MAANGPNSFGIRDNHTRGKVADFLVEKINAGSHLSVVSAYFTIYAYEALSAEQDSIVDLNFLFGEPRFIASLDPDKTDKRSFKIEDEGLELANRLQQKDIARRCAAWIRDKVEIRSIRQANLLHGKLYHIDDGRREHAILGSSNFTRRGLGLSATPNIELNLIVDGDRDRAELKEWFDQLWADESLVADVKAEVLRYLEQLYVNHAPEFIYFKTLFHVFERFLSGQADDAQLFDRTAIVDTDIWKTLFDFQKDGAKGAIHKINAHNGCILPPGQFFSLTENPRAARNKLLEGIPGSLYESVLKGTPKEHRELLVSGDDTDLDGNPALQPADKGKLKSKRNDLRKVLKDDGWAKIEAVEALDRVLEMTERVLNPASHGNTAPLYEEEVRRAKRLIDRMEQALATRRWT